MVLSVVGGGSPLTLIENQLVPGVLSVVGGGSPTTLIENQLVPWVLSAAKWGWVVVLPEKVKNPVSTHDVWY